MTGYPQIGFNPYNMYQNWGYGYQYPAFRVVQNQPQPVSVPQPNVNLQTQPDTVSFRATEHIQTKPKKEGLSTGAKWAIGLGLTGLACLGARYGLQNKIKKAYKNIKITELPENIIFKKATSKEEALKFTKETLKIKDVEASLTLEELNFINKSLVDVSNAQKGKCVMPARIKYFDDEYIKMLDKGNKGMTLAGIDCTILGKDFGTLNINKNFLKEERLNSELKKLYYKKDGTIKFKPNTPYKYSEKVYGIADNEMSILLEKYYKNPNSLSLEQKLQLIESRYSFLNNISNLERGIDIGINKTKSGYLIEKMKLQSEGHTIYHEMGHLQDLFAKKEAHISSPILTEINMRRDMLNIFPTKTHKEFINDKSIQEITGKVSPYSQTSSDEFIAEVYAGLVSGKKFSDDVIALYKKYGGPALT